MKKIDIGSIKIKLLNSESKHFDKVSYWIWNYWGKKERLSLKDIRYHTKYCITARIPFILIALYKNKVIGTVSIYNNDLWMRQDLIPWLAALYVKDEYRSIGIGALLQRKAIERVRKLGYTNLYLMTDHKKYYEKNGWKFLELSYAGKGKKTRIYQYKIS